MHDLPYFEPRSPDPDLAEALRGLLQTHEVTELLHREAQLLDDWQLSEWFIEILTDDVTYEVPATDVSTPSPDCLGLISDDAPRLRQRVEQLLGNDVWCENPRSRTNRIIGNVMIIDERADERGQTLTVGANFVIHRMGHGRTDCYVGKYRHELIRTEIGLRIRRRVAMLDHETLAAHGKISIIL